MRAVGLSSQGTADPSSRPQSGASCPPSPPVRTQAAPSPAPRPAADRDHLVPSAPRSPGPPSLPERVLGLLQAPHRPRRPQGKFLSNPGREREFAGHWVERRTQKVLPWYPEQGVAIHCRWAQRRKTWLPELGVGSRGPRRAGWDRWAEGDEILPGGALRAVAAGRSLPVAPSNLAGRLGQSSNPLPGSHSPPGQPRSQLSLLLPSFPCRSGCPAEVTSTAFLSSALRSCPLPSLSLWVQQSEPLSCSRTFPDFRTLSWQCLAPSSLPPFLWPHLWI